MPAKKPTKGRADGLRWGEGSVVERASGGWQARWAEPQPTGGEKRRARTFPSRDEAEDHLRTVYRDRRDGRYVPPSEATVADLVNDWLTRGASRWKPSTVANYRQRAETHVLPALGAIRADTLKTPRIQHWIDGMVKAGLKPATVDAAHRVLTSALREATQIGIIDDNPAARTRRPPITIEEAPTWTQADIAKVMDAIGDDPMWRAFYRVALTTGMRPGEVRALKWADLNLEDGVLTIRRTMTKDADRHDVIGETTKTGRSRAVALAAPVVRLLKLWRVEQTTRRLAAAVWHDHDLIFTRRDGRFLPQTATREFQTRIAEAIGVKAITHHQLRHTHATLELEAGTHPKIVAERLGHRSIQTTLDRYSHVSVDLRRTAAEALDSRIFGPDDDADDATTSAQ